MATLFNVKSLYPDFSPFVAKYFDNGGSGSLNELQSYFDYYKINSADYWRDIFFAKSEDIFRKYISEQNPLWNSAKIIKNKFL